MTRNRHSFARFVSLALAGASLTWAAAPLATNPALTFFSSITEEPLARLEAESIAPRFVKHGPFTMPAPGVTIEAPTLTLHDQPCTADDWSRLLQELGRWQGTGSGIHLLLTLPDGRSVVFQRPPSAASGMLSGFVRPLNLEKGKAPELQLLRVVHDGKQRLHVDLRALPAEAARPPRFVRVEPEPAPEPDSAPPSPPLPPPPTVPSESIPLSP